MILEKICKNCNIEYPLSNFYDMKKKTGKVYKQTNCKSCSKQISKSYPYKPRPNREPRVWDLNERTCLKSVYGISTDEFLIMLEFQEDRCLSCLSFFTYESKMAVPHVDHCHKIGKIRGLLCGFCNMALGHLKDSAAKCRALARYVTQNG